MNYTEAQLQTKTIDQLQEIAYSLADSARIKNIWIREILGVMPQKVEEVEVSEISSTVEQVEAPVKTCIDCPLFQPFKDGSGRGLCCGSDRVAREHHEQTGDCLHLIEAHKPESEPLVNADDASGSCIKGNPGYGMGFEHPYWIDGWDILFEINLLQHGAEDMDGDCWVNFGDGIWLSSNKESQVSVLWKPPSSSTGVASLLLELVGKAA